MLIYNNNYLKKWNYSRYKKDFENIKKTLFAELKIKHSREISIVFVDNTLSQQLNKEYRGKDYPTDVISFAFDQGNEKVAITSPCLGEIIISVDKAWEQAKEYGHSKRREICFLFTHGLLHTLGYDHKTPQEEKMMFGLQKSILNKVNIRR